MALLLAVAPQAAAQAYHPPTPDQQDEMDLQALDASGWKQRAEILRRLERPGPWTLYGGLGLLNFRNQIDPESSGLQFSWRRTGPRIGKIHIGIQRRF